MKVNKLLLKKKWFLISLGLLSSEVFAIPPEDKLNLDYTRPEVSILDPRLSKIGEVCHSLDDSMDIKVDFTTAMITNNASIKMTIKGNDVRRGYAGVGGETKETVADDLYFLKKWGISTNGELVVDYEKNVSVPVKKWKYVDQFCFNQAIMSHFTPQWKISQHYIPIYDNPPYATGLDNNNENFRKYCIGSRESTEDGSTYWPSESGKDFQNPPQAVRAGLEKPFDEYLGKYIFYRGREEVSTGGSVNKPETGTLRPSTEWVLNQTGSDKDTYVFPIQPAGSFQSRVNPGGWFHFKLNNRNISSLTLDLALGDNHNIFRWERDVNSLDNTLVFKGVTTAPHLGSAGNVKDDPYASFYDKSKTGPDFYFGGTLVKGSFLTSDYKNYIKNTIPLSLPPTHNGDINLVNTHSLTLLIGRTEGFGSGDYAVTVYGQPLKFGPLYNGNKEVVSAMQVRNACH